MPGDFGRDLDQPLLVALAHDPQRPVPLLLAEGAERRPQGVHAAQAGADHEGQQRPVPQPQQRGRVYLLQQVAGLLAGQPQRLALVRDLEAAQAGGGVRGDQAASLGLGEELAGDGDLAADAGRGARLRGIRPGTASPAGQER